MREGCVISTHRGLFIIDPKGVLRQITMNDLSVSAVSIASAISSSCLQVGRSVDETLRLVQAIQYTDTNGEGKPRPLI